MIQDFMLPFLAVGLAELGDKTQISLLLLSSKVKSHPRLLLGVMLAFLVVDGVAVLAGSWIVGVVPTSFVKVLSGIVFLAFGVLILRGGHEAGEGRLYSKSPLVSGFALVFMAEWGDKTQVASGLFAVEYNPLVVLLGAMAALGVLSALSIYLGKVLSSKLDRKLVAKIAGAVFVLMGASFILL